ncbi:MAG: helix-turn-helix transcriptional regulator, partial [Thermoguttaceae bacterium]
MSRRTIFRDLDVLRQSGVPLIFDENEQRYHVPSDYYLPPTNFTPDEALALIVLCSDLGEHARLPFFRPAHSAALKLESSLPDRLRRQLRGPGAAIKIRLEPSNQLAEHQTVYDQLVDALARRRCVRIGYRGPLDSEEMSTRVQPYRLLFSRRSWYLIGRSSLHRSVRTFNVGRITRLEVLDQACQVPRGFSLSRYLGNAWHLVPEPGPDREVVVRFTRLVAQNVAEVAWHRTQRLEFNDDGTLQFHVTVSGLTEISWWILGYGDQAEVLVPVELRQRIAEKAAKMAAIYSDIHAPGSV